MPFGGHVPLNDLADCWVVVEEFGVQLRKEHPAIHPLVDYHPPLRSELRKLLFKSGLRQGNPLHRL
jgi:hypothetical protein